MPGGHCRDNTWHVRAALGVLPPHRRPVTGHHARGPVEALDRRQVLRAGHGADEHVLDQRPAGPVAVQVQAQHVGRVEERLVGGQADEDLRIRRVDADVPAAVLLGRRTRPRCRAGRRTSGRTPAGPTPCPGWRRHACRAAGAPDGGRQERSVPGGGAVPTGADRDGAAPVAAPRRSCLEPRWPGAEGSHSHRTTGREAVGGSSFAQRPHRMSVSPDGERGPTSVVAVLPTSS